MVVVSPSISLATYLLYFFLTAPNSHLCTHNERNAVCPQIFSPVCALVKGINNSSQISNYYESTSFGNGCSACSNSSVVGYTPGACSEVKICPKPRQVLPCPMTPPGAVNNNSVCTFSQNTVGHNLKVSAQTSANSCQACNSDDSKFWTTGSCDTLSPNICLPSQRKPQICPDFVMKLCAYYKGGDCKETLCKKNVESNGCFLCADATTVFWTMGAC